MDELSRHYSAMLSREMGRFLELYLNISSDRWMVAPLEDEAGCRVLLRSRHAATALLCEVALMSELGTASVRGGPVSEDGWTHEVVVIEHRPSIGDEKIALFSVN